MPVLIFLFLLFFLLTANAVRAQDYIIDWKNDTISVRLPSKPRKEKMRPAWKYHNGHIRLACYFKEDSLRILEAGSVKGYYRKKHGADFLCDGHFESLRAIGWRDNRHHRPETEGYSWYFMNRVWSGIHASLYMVYLQTGNEPRQLYFIRKHGQPETEAHYFEGKTTRRALLADPEIAAEIEEIFSGPKWRRTLELVRTYDRLKEAASGKLPATDRGNSLILQHDVEE